MTMSGHFADTHGLTHDTCTVSSRFQQASQLAYVAEVRLAFASVAHMLRVQMLCSMEGQLVA